MPTYLNFAGQAVATSAAAHAWISTSAHGQTLSANTTTTSLSDSYGGATLIGGSVDDSFSISDSAEQILVTATNVTDTVNSWTNFTLPTNVNNLNLEVANVVGVGNSGDNLLVALAGGDMLIAGSGSDVLVDNGAGGEKFQFGANASTDVIYGFQASGANADVIQLTNSPYSNFSQLQSHLTQQGADTLLPLSSAQQILIRNTLVSSLTASNFGLSVGLSGVATSFDDEFNSLSLWNPADGTGVWKTNYISGIQNGHNSWTSRTLQPNQEQEIYVDPSYAGSAGGTTALGLNPFSISNGVLAITASPTPGEDLSALNNFKYISGLLTTEKSFTQTYGYFEMKAELPSGQGVWPAFWLLPAGGGWPPELDVMEQIGGADVYEHSHYTTSTGAATSVGFKSYFPGNSTGFHTYGVLWTPTTLAWYLDGVEVGTAPTPSDMNKPMYMLVNLAMGGPWTGNAPSNFASAQMQVDYVRAYSLSSLNLPSGAAPSAIRAEPNAAAPSAAAPITTTSSYSGQAGHGLTVSAAQGVLSGDTDHNGLTLQAALAQSGGPQHGTLTLNADGSFTYTPDAGFAGTDSFTYIASDSASSSAATSVTLHVNAANPTGVGVSYNATAGKTLNISAIKGLLAGDSDANGLALTAHIQQGPGNGVLTLDANGSFSYTPNAGFTGSDSFTYVPEDPLGAGVATTVTINVAAAGASASGSSGTSSSTQGSESRGATGAGISSTLLNHDTGAPNVHGLADYSLSHSSHADALIQLLGVHANTGATIGHAVFL